MSPFRPSLFLIFFFGTTSAEKEFFLSSTPIRTSNHGSFGKVTFPKDPWGTLAGRWTKADGVEMHFSVDGTRGGKIGWSEAVWLDGIYPDHEAANIVEDAVQLCPFYLWPPAPCSQTADALHFSFTWPSLKNGWSDWGQTTFVLNLHTNVLLEKNQFEWTKI